MDCLNISLTLVSYSDIIISVIAARRPSASCDYHLSLPSYVFSGAHLLAFLHPHPFFFLSVWHLSSCKGTQDLISTPAQTCNVVALTEEVMISAEAMAAPSWW